MSEIELIKKIREKTGLSFADIKKAVASSGSTDEDKIIEQLRKQGVLKQASRSDRTTSNGSIFSYVHEGRIGVLLEIKCETDFVARSEIFQDLGKNVALHIAAYQPKAVNPEDIDTTFLDKELEIAKEQLIKENKPQEMIEKILLGKKAKITEENSLLGQPFLKDPKIIVSQYLAQIGLSTGEKIQITRFTIFSLT
jgi:elongation factor Ts